MATAGVESLQNPPSVVSTITISDVNSEENVQDKLTGKDFISVPLEELTRKKIPRQVIHCSDGVVEEYSTDEEEEESQPPPVDPKTLDWVPWTWFKLKSAGCKTLAAVDICGEKLAYAFGITSPKYQYAIDEYHRMRAEEKEEAEREYRERAAELKRQKESQLGQSVESCYRVEPDDIAILPTSNSPKDNIESL